jgi:hypothetical protein
MHHGRPAHELGHHSFDFLGSWAITAFDTLIAQGYPNEIMALAIAGGTHDIATGVVPRYQDDQWECDHGQVGAYIIYQILKDIVPEPILLIACYHVATHSDINKEIVTKTGYTRPPYTGTLFFDNGRPVRITIAVRGPDRLEAGGDKARHFPRHAVAIIDGAQTKNGRDFHHQLGWYEMASAPLLIFTPSLTVVDGIPSALRHMEGYQLSAKPEFKVNHYNQFDHLFDTFGKLMRIKIANSEEFISSVLATPRSKADFEDLRPVLVSGSGIPNSKLSKEAIVTLEEIWKNNKNEEQDHWAWAFTNSATEYRLWISTLRSQILQAKNPSVIAFHEVLPTVLKHIDL